MRNCLFAGWISFAAFAVGCGKNPTDDPKPEPKVVKETPPTAVDLRVGKIDAIKAELAKNAGRVVVLDIWASWCDPCKEGFPHLVKQFNARFDEGLRVVSVTIDLPGDQEKDARDFLTSAKAYFPAIRYEYDVWKQGADLLHEELFPKVAYEDGVPVTIVYGRDGKLVKAFTGSDKTPEKELDEAIESALNAK